MLQPGFGGTAGPIIVSPGKPVNGAGDGIVEIPERSGSLEPGCVEQAGKKCQAGQGTGFQGGQKMPGIDAVETLGEGMAAGGQVERRADGSDSGDLLPGRRALLAGPLEQGIATEGNANRLERAAQVERLQAGDDPVDFLAVA